MEKQIEEPILIFEEKRTIKWFLVLFYIITLTFDLFYDYIIPTYITHTHKSSPNVLRNWIYFLLLTLIPYTYYLNKKQKQYLIKYTYFISYTILAVFNESFSFIDKPSLYNSGSPVEIFWLLLSPIFVSRRFFTLVSLGLIVKYVVVGSIIHSPNVFFPILMVITLSIFSYILLSRFHAYVQAVKISYDHQLVGIVKGVIATLELKDPYTRGHSERVAKYALTLAKEVNDFSKEELKTFNYACLLHDIGKVQIPDHILMKPTTLTKDEYEIIKTHPLVGEKAVSGVNGLKSCIAVIRSHHERWDGKGYPDQLEGENIPLFARITAVADAFDAMTSSRSYRGALTVEEAYKRIIDGEGSQFDPELVKVFKRIYPTWTKIHEDWIQNPDVQLMDNSNNL